MGFLCVQWVIIIRPCFDIFYIMKRIVVITTPGSAKNDFINVLQQKTGSVCLVIRQHERPRTIYDRVRRMFKKVQSYKIIYELYYAFQVSFSSSVRYALGLAKKRTPILSVSSYTGKVLDTYDVRSDEVYEAVRSMSPDVIAVWGGAILDNRLITIAPKIFNIHTGYCPYYRGTNGHFNAILNDDMKHIGITLHEIVTAVDAGAIVEVIVADIKKKPNVFFCDMNDRAFWAYVKLIQKVIEGESYTAIPQDVTKGAVYKLKDWTYEKQYRVAKQILQLEAQKE